VASNLASVGLSIVLAWRAQRHHSVGLGRTRLRSGGQQGMKNGWESGIEFTTVPIAPVPCGGGDFQVR
jgi:hypothetical protein